VTLSLGAFVLGALDPAEHAEVERHTRICISCAAETADLARTARML
jgi:anti-sigma factor RsiW